MRVASVGVTTIGGDGAIPSNRSLIQLNMFCHFFGRLHGKMADIFRYSIPEYGANRTGVFLVG